jgi:hypothetical protein
METLTTSYSVPHLSCEQLREDRDMFGLGQWETQEQNSRAYINHHHISAPSMWVSRYHTTSRPRNDISVCSQACSQDFKSSGLEAWSDNIPWGRITSGAERVDLTTPFTNAVVAATKTLTAGIAD